MADADRASVHTDSSQHSEPQPNDEVATRPNAHEFTTVQIVQDMLDNAYDDQRMEMDLRMKEMKDYVMALVKPLKDAMGVLETNCLVRHTGGEAGGSSHASERKVTYKTFRSTSPPAFKGSTDPIKAVEWLTKIESCFELAEINGIERVKYATSCLIGSALLWWTTTSKAMEVSELKALTWEKFKDLFEEKYCPLDRLDELESQFMQLTQGEKSVTEYEDEFLKKSLFAKHQVSTERRKVQRFVRGLKPEIRQFVRGRDIATFSKAVEAARDQEQELALCTIESLANKKPKLTGNIHQNSSQSTFKHSKGRAYSANAQPSRALPSHKSVGSKSFYADQPSNSCRRCGKYHKSRCPVSDPACYRCGEPGHMSFECPQRGNLCCSQCGEVGHAGIRCPNRQSRSESRGAVARPAATPTHSVPDGAFQITTNEAPDAPDVVMGIFTVNTMPH